MKYNYFIDKHSRAIIHHNSESEENIVELPPNIYSLANYGFISPKVGFKPYEGKENLIKFSGGIVSRIINKIDTFFSSDTIGRYNDIKMPHKVGMIMHGKPGTGKTSTSFLIMDIISKKYNGICIDVTGYDLSFIKQALNVIRYTNPESPIIVFCDEFDSSINRYEEEYLSFLDGSHSYSGIVFIGCTNYLDKIPDRIKNRKSRIKYVFEISSLPIEIYEEYLIKKTDVLPTNIVKEIAFKAADNGLTIDQLKHVLIDFYVDGTDIDVAIRTALLKFKEEENDED